MTYTKKMHESARRETAGKHNIVTDLLDEIERLQNSLTYIEKDMVFIPCANFYNADRYNTDNEYVLHLWDGRGNCFDIQIPIK